MPTHERDGVRIHYEVHGEGFPILLFAPGGMRSSIPFWRRTPWDPIEALSPDWRCIVMDQRNAGSSWAPIRGDQGWDDYTADHLALLDHLGIERCALLGMCIGGSFILDALAKEPQRFVAAVALQPIGFADNLPAFHAIYASWREEVAPDHSEATDADWRGLRNNLYGAGDFVFSITREQARAIETPLLVLRGDDLYHPDAISREVASLVRNGTLVEDWKEPPARDAAIESVRSFLATHAS